MKTVFVWIIVLYSSINLFGEEFIGSIKGKIINKSTKQPVELITIKVMNTKFGTISKKDGTFIIEKIPEGVYHLEFSMVGYSKVVENSVRVIRNKTSVVKEIEMQEDNFQTQDVIVSADKNRSTEARALSYSYSKSEIMRTPGTAGEVFRAIAALPGVSTGGGENAGFMVRGASPSENIILVDGFPFSKITHYSDGASDDLASGGRFSIFSPMVIENAEFQGVVFHHAMAERMLPFSTLKLKKVILKTIL